jgi:L-lactate utilization protein LutC
MTTSPREAFLQRVRQALGASNRPGQTIPLPSRGRAGYQGAGPDPCARFGEMLAAAGGQAYTVADSEAAATTVLDLVRARSAKNILLGRGPFLDPLNLAERLRQSGATVLEVDQLPPDASRDAFFAADLGISGVNYLVAETGSVVMLAGPTEPRSLTLLPPVHIAVADRTQLLPDLFDLFGPEISSNGPNIPSGMTLITGPSKTGDIELRLVTGVHGPGEVHVIVIGPEVAQS